MFSILHTLAAFVADLVKSRNRLEAELLRHQLNVALRNAPARLQRPKLAHRAQRKPFPFSV
jgi:hypothetical protein